MKTGVVDRVIAHASWLAALGALVALPLGTPSGASAKILLPWMDTCPCEWRSPGVFYESKAAFVQCAIDATRAARAEGRITRRQARQSLRVARQGPCGRPSFTRKATCGGPEARVCPDPETLCSYIGPVCTPGRWGYCVNRGCSPIGDVAPVCGCDGKTYDRFCMAIDAGVEVAHVGRCEDPSAR